MKMLYYLFELMKIVVAAVDAIVMMNYLHTGGFCDYYWAMMRRCGNVAMTHSYYYYSFGMKDNKREMTTMPQKQRMEDILACLLWI